MTLFYTFANEQMIGLSENNWILISGSVLMLQYIGLVEVYEENLTSQVIQLETEDLTQSQKCLRDSQRSLNYTLTTTALY